MLMIAMENVKCFRTVLYKIYQFNSVNIEQLPKPLAELLCKNSLFFIYTYIFCLK